MSTTDDALASDGVGLASSATSTLVEERLRLPEDCVSCRIQTPFRHHGQDFHPGMLLRHVMATPEVILTWLRCQLCHWARLRARRPLL